MVEIYPNRGRRAPSAGGQRAKEERLLVLCPSVLEQSFLFRSCGRHAHCGSRLLSLPMPDPLTPDPTPLPPLTRPPALQKGDTIGVVAPSYAPRPGWLARGGKALGGAGYGI